MIDVEIVSIEAGAARILFSDARAAEVTSAIMKPELRPGFGIKKAGRPGERRVDEHRTAPLHDIADLGRREGEHVGRERDRLGVEIAARKDLASIGHHQRIVGDAVRLTRQHRGCRTYDIEGRTHHLRLATQRIGVLHARIVGEMRAANLAVGHQRAEHAGDVDLAGLAAQGLDAGIERRIGSRRCVDRHGAGEDRRGECVLDGE